MFVEETTIPSAHVVVADQPTFTNSNRSQILQAVHESAFVNPLWQRPMFLWYDLVVALSRCEIFRRSFELVGKGFIVEEDPGVLMKYL